MASQLVDAGGLLSDQYITDANLPDVATFSLVRIGLGTGAPGDPKQSGSIYMNTSDSAIIWPEKPTAGDAVLLWETDKNGDDFLSLQTANGNLADRFGCAAVNFYQPGQPAAGNTTQMKGIAAGGFQLNGFNGGAGVATPYMVANATQITQINSHPPVVWAGTWAAGAYPAGAMVIHTGVTYVAQVAAVAGNVPGAAPTVWVALP